MVNNLDHIFKTEKNIPADDHVWFDDDAVQVSRQDVDGGKQSCWIFLESHRRVLTD